MKLLSTLVLLSVLSSYQLAESLNLFGNQDTAVYDYLKAADKFIYAAKLYASLTTPGKLTRKEKHMKTSTDVQIKELSEKYAAVLALEIRKSSEAWKEKIKLAIASLEAATKKTLKAILKVLSKASLGYSDDEHYTYLALQAFKANDKLDKEANDEGTKILSPLQSLVDKLTRAADAFGDNNTCDSSGNDRNPSADVLRKLGSQIKKISKQYQKALNPSSFDLSNPDQTDEIKAQALKYLEQLETYLLDAASKVLSYFGKGQQDYAEALEGCAGIRSAFRLLAATSSGLIRAFQPVEILYAGGTDSEQDLLTAATKLLNN